MQSPLPKFAVEAIVLNALFHARLMRTITARPDAPKLTLSLLPFVSLFVVESHGRLTEAMPGFKVDPVDAVDFVLPARHRTKLLLSRMHDVVEVVESFGAVAAAEREHFLSLHNGLLAPIKRLLQPDLGITTIEGHIISTTHALRFMSGLGTPNSESFRTAGYVVSAYCTKLIEYFSPNLDLYPFPEQVLPPLEDKDIKSSALYGRGEFGTLPANWAAVLTMILANLNFIHRVMRPLVPRESKTFLKLRTLQTFNALHSIRRVQDRLRHDGKLSSQAARVLADAISTPDGRWLRRRDDLRDTLIHFRPRKVKSEHVGLSYDEAIAAFCGRTVPKLEESVDRLLEHLTRTLSEGFRLNSTTFSYGRIEESTV